MSRANPAARKALAAGLTERWRLFLASAGTEFLAPPVVALVALAALLLLMVGPGLIGIAPRWMYAVPGCVFLGATFWGWVTSYRRVRAIEDVPLSKIASVAQGYARIEGRAALLPGGKPPLSYSGQPCCWYRRHLRVVDDEGEVEHYESEESDWSFVIAEGANECVVDPVGARVVPLRFAQWNNTRTYWTEYLILPGDAVCVIGEFATSSAEVSEQEIDFRVGERVGDWKRDMASLRRRFDLNQDGRFSEQEWELVRREARRQVKAELAVERAGPQNLIARPRDGRPFLISAEPPEQLARDLAIWTWLHAVAFVGGVALLAWLYLRFF